VARLDRGAPQLEFVRTKDIIERHLPLDRSTIVDVGGGPGRYAAWLSAIGHDVHLLQSPSASSRHALPPAMILPAA